MVHYNIAYVHITALLAIYWVFGLYDYFRLIGNDLGTKVVNRASFTPLGVWSPGSLAYLPITPFRAILCRSFAMVIAIYSAPLIDSMNVSWI